VYNHVYKSIFSFSAVSFAAFTTARKGKVAFRPFSSHAYLIIVLSLKPGFLSYLNASIHQEYIFFVDSSCVCKFYQELNLWSFLTSEKWKNLFIKKRDVVAINEGVECNILWCALITREVRTHYAQGARTNRVRFARYDALPARISCVTIRRLRSIPTPTQTSTPRLNCGHLRTSVDGRVQLMKHLYLWKNYLRLLIRRAHKSWIMESYTPGIDYQILLSLVYPFENIHRLNQIERIPGRL
jgi:hypothetical protein